MDHIIKLPRTKVGCDAIVVQVCRLTKRRVFTPIKTIDENGSTDVIETAKIVFYTA